jgi:hypothetical protein
MPMCVHIPLQAGTFKPLNGARKVENVSEHRLRDSYRRAAQVQERKAGNDGEEAKPNRCLTASRYRPLLAAKDRMHPGLR